MMENWSKIGTNTTTLFKLSDQHDFTEKWPQSDIHSIIVTIFLRHDQRVDHIRLPLCCLINIFCGDFITEHCKCRHIWCDFQRISQMVYLILHWVAWLMWFMANQVLCCKFEKNFWNNWRNRTAVFWTRILKKKLLLLRNYILWHFLVETFCGLTAMLGFFYQDIQKKLYTL